MDKSKIFLNFPGEPTIYLLIEAPTGVVYEMQCGGLRCELREAEGFLVPTYRSAPDIQTVGDEPDINKHQLAKIKECCSDLEIMISDVHVSTEIDESRMDEWLEAWIPARIGTFRGYFVWNNSD